MTEPNAAIVEQYAEHLSGKAASSVLSFALVGVAGGAALGAIPGHLSHSLLANGVNYFAVLLGALAGGIAGRSLGDKRAVGLRLQAQLALRQLQVEELLLHRAPAAAAAVPPLSAPALAPAPVATPAPALVPPLAAPVAPTPAPPPAPAPAPVAAPPPAEPFVVPTVAFPNLQPTGATAPPVVAPAPVPLAAAPSLPVAPPAPPPVRAVPAGPQLVEQEPAMPPLSY
jgi:hypothetical protein